MVAKAEIRLLNPLSPRCGYKLNFIRDIQDLVSYSHSRFYAALVAMAEETSMKELQLMQMLLQRELMFVMNYVGIATCVGIPLELPLVLRSLADSLAFLTAEDFPIKMDGNFLSWVGTAFYIEMPEHAMNWWRTKPARRIEGHFLQVSTVDACLELFRQQRLQTEGAPPTRAAEQPSAHKNWPPQRCESCRETRVMYIEAADTLIKAMSVSSAQKEITRADAEMGRRKMAAAYELAELAVLKETAFAKTGNAATTSRPLSGKVDPIINTQSQWTFGPSLTPQEIIGRFGSKSCKGKSWDPQGRQWHSGYFRELHQGKFNADGGSATDSNVEPPEEVQFSSVGTSAKQAPPSTNNLYPINFWSHKHRFTPIQTQASNTLTVKPDADTFFKMFGTPTPENTAKPAPANPDDFFNMFGQLDAVDANADNESDRHPAANVMPQHPDLFFDMYASAGALNATAVSDVRNICTPVPAPMTEHVSGFFDMYGPNSPQTSSRKTPDICTASVPDDFFAMYGPTDTPLPGHDAADGALDEPDAFFNMYGSMEEAVGGNHVEQQQGSPNPKESGSSPEGTDTSSDISEYDTESAGTGDVQSDNNEDQRDAQPDNQSDNHNNPSGSVNPLPATITAFTKYDFAALDAHLFDMSGDEDDPEYM